MQNDLCKHNGLLVNMGGTKFMMITTMKSKSQQPIIKYVKEHGSRQWLHNAMISTSNLLIERFSKNLECDLLEMDENWWITISDWTPPP